MEPIVTGSAILSSKELLTKLLGPTADYLGGEIKGFVQKCNINLDNIFKKATLKLGDKINEKGSVSPRVLKHVVDEGRFCEDELTAEYYGGVLASSRSERSRDDRGVVLLAIIKALSVYQLRFHFIAYSLFREIFRNANLNLADQKDIQRMRIFVPTKVFKHAMAFSSNEDMPAIMIHCLFGLRRHDLITDFASGDLEYMKVRFPLAAEDGMMISPSVLGAELYLWAAGLQGAAGIELLTCNLPDSGINVEIKEGSIPLTSPLA